MCTGICNCSQCTRKKSKEVKNTNEKVEIQNVKESKQKEEKKRIEKYESKIKAKTTPMIEIKRQGSKKGKGE